MKSTLNPIEELISTQLLRGFNKNKKWGAYIGETLLTFNNGKSSFESQKLVRKELDKHIYTKSKMSRMGTYVGFLTIRGFEGTIKIDLKLINRLKASFKTMEYNQLERWNCYGSILEELGIIEIKRIPKKDG